MLLPWDATFWRPLDDEKKLEVVPATSSRAWPEYCNQQEYCTQECTQRPLMAAKTLQRKGHPARMLSWHSLFNTPRSEQCWLSAVASTQRSLLRPPLLPALLLLNLHLDGRSGEGGVRRLIWARRGSWENETRKAGDGWLAPTSERERGPRQKGRGKYKKINVAHFIKSVITPGYCKERFVNDGLRRLHRRRPQERFK